MPPSEPMTHTETFGVNSALGLPMPIRAPDVSRNPGRTLPVNGKDREMMPHSIDDTRSEGPRMRCMLDIGEGTGMCAMLALRDLFQRLSKIIF